MCLENIKGMWLSQFDLACVYQKNGQQRPKTEFEALVNNMYDKLVDMGFNTVIVQTRPNADSMYPSEIYPLSKYVVGKYGNDAEYDAFEVLVRLAHEKSLQIHAWINPMRCMTCNEIQAVPDKFTIGKWYNGGDVLPMMKKVGNNYYLDPAYEEVRSLIVSGAEEILERYDVNGLHMDDYFYPTAEEFFDAESYSEYKSNGGALCLEDFRRENLDKLVSSLYSAVKKKNKKMPFGISPAGVISSVINKHFANVERWCSEEGFVDYICPQIYFGILHPTCPYFTLCRDWQDMIKNDKVKLIIGMTLGKAFAGKDEYAKENSDEWALHKDIMLRCLEDTVNLPSCIGVCYFCYQYFYDPLSGEDKENTRQERENFIPLLKKISW